jgi:hypothetical protein
MLAGPRVGPFRTSRQINLALAITRMDNRHD